MIGFTIVKGLARLVLFFIATFAFFLLSGTVVAITRTVVAASAAFPQRELPTISTILNALRFSLPLSLIISICTSLLFASRHRIFPFLAFLVCVCLGTACLFGVAIGTEHLNTLVKDTFQGEPSKQLGQEGRILFTPNIQAVLLEQNSETGPVVIIADPLLPFQKVSSPEAQKNLTVQDIFGPLVQFSKQMQTIVTEISFLSEKLVSHIRENLLAFVVLAAAISISFSSLFVFSSAIRWPLANLLVSIFLARSILLFFFYLGSFITTKASAVFFPNMSTSWRYSLLAILFALILALFSLLAEAAFERRERE